MKYYVRRCYTTRPGRVLRVGDELDDDDEAVQEALSAGVLASREAIERERALNWSPDAGAVLSGEYDEVMQRSLYDNPLRFLATNLHQFESTEEVIAWARREAKEAKPLALFVSTHREWIEQERRDIWAMVGELEKIGRGDLRSLLLFQVIRLFEIALEVTTGGDMTHRLRARYYGWYPCKEPQPLRRWERLVIDEDADVFGDFDVVSYQPRGLR